MTFNEKQIQDGNLRLQDMKVLVHECNAKAAELHLTLGWSVRGRGIRASIKQKGKIIWQHHFTTDNFAHNLCMMYETTHQKLTALMTEQIAIDRAAQKEAKEREEERRIAAMPSWGEKIKGQG